MEYIKNIGRRKHQRGATPCPRGWGARPTPLGTPPASWAPWQASGAHLLLYEVFIPEKIQNQINKLILIAEKWAESRRLEDASLLCDYIQIVKQEFNLRSNIVKINLGNFEEKIPAIKEKAQNSTEKKIEKKRLKKAGHADNTHKETYLDKNGIPVENRKVQKHKSRFKK